MEPWGPTQITGHLPLALSARRAMVTLWRNAQLQGVDNGKDYTIAVAELCPDDNETETIEETILSLMQTVLTIRFTSGGTRRIQCLGGNDMVNVDRAVGILTYSLDKILIDILRDPASWSRLRNYCIDSSPTLMRQ